MLYRGKGSNLSFSFVGSKLWNTLPITVRNCDNIKDFKRGLHKCNLQAFY